MLKHVTLFKLIIVGEVDKSTLKLRTSSHEKTSLREYKSQSRGLQFIQLINDSYPEYIKSEKSDISIEKKWHFTSEEIQMANNLIKKCSSSIMQKTLISTIAQVPYLLSTNRKQRSPFTALWSVNCIITLQNAWALNDKV